MNNFRYLEYCNRNNDVKQKVGRLQECTKQDKKLFRRGKGCIRLDRRRNEDIPTI